MLGLLPIFPAFWAFDTIEATMKFSESEYHYYLAAIPLLAWPTAFVLVLTTIALGRRFSLDGFAAREGGKIFGLVVLLSAPLGRILGDAKLRSIRCRLFMQRYTCGLGTSLWASGSAKVSEIATNLAGRYDIVALGENCFVADEVSLADEDIRRGWMHLKSVATGDRVFIGNDAVVPPGTKLPSDALIGVKSKPPAERERCKAARRGSARRRSCCRLAREWIRLTSL